MGLRKTIFGKSKKVNTIIGGIAKTGGTGVNAPIDTPTKLATKLGIDVAKITRFYINGDNIECMINGSYTLPNSCFGNTTPANANTNITSYHDLDGLVTALGYYVFRNCTNFTDFTFSSNLTSIGNTAFAYTSIINADLSYLQEIISGENNWFFGCSLLETVDLGEYIYNEYLSYTVLNQTFRNCIKLDTILTKVQGYYGTFRYCDGIVNFSNAYVTKVDSYSFAYLNGVCDTITLSENLYFGEAVFYFSKVKKVISPKVIQIVRNYCFRNCSTIEEIDIRACKSMNDPATYTQIFRDIKAGCLIRVHEYMATNNSGAADADLTYAKASRGAIVEFYDDAGNYVATL